MQPDSYLSPILYLMDGKLHRNVEAVQNIASKHQWVLWSVDSMDPPLLTEITKEIRNTQDPCKYGIQVKFGITVHWRGSESFLLTSSKPPCQHTRWDEEGVSLLKLHSLASVSSVSQEDITLLAWQDPVLIKGKVMRGRRHEPKHLRRSRVFYF